MGTMTGMDIEAVKALAKEMKSSATQIDEIVKKLTSKLGSAQWVGADQKKFDGDWKGTHTPALKKVSEGLKKAGTTAETNAREQEEASRK